MIAWIKRLFHLHTWEEIQCGTWSDKGRRGNYYDCRCKECGRIKEFRT